MKVSMENLKNVLSNKINLLLILAGLVLVFQLFSLLSNGREALKVNYIKEEISKLKEDVQEIYKSEKALDKKIDTFNLQIKNIHEAVIINNTKIEKLKKDEKIQIDKFKSYNARMWERYFTDRYSKKQ
jgi:septal ring factor EnvC (AmiA/AmiB activator)